ncbi:MAG: hypothetical protein QM784_16045 [Polyangiaceae bacterium]
MHRRPTPSISSRSRFYEAEVNRPWQPGLELHTNYTFAGQKTPEYEGQEVPHHALRLTLEPALGITEFLEVGAYLQNMMNRDGEYRFSGFKLRTKFVVPKRYTGKFFFGLNAEIGKVPRAIEAEGWANEFRPIIGWYNGTWLFDVNPIFGYALSGSEKFRPDLEPGGKIGFNTQRGFMIGAEYYAGLGLLTSVSPVSEQSHLLFLTFDLAEPHTVLPEPPPAAPTDPNHGAVTAKEDDEEDWELNIGFGRSLTDATPQQWILKTIVGRAF